MSDVQTTQPTAPPPPPSAWQSFVALVRAALANWHKVVLVATVLLSLHTALKHADTSADVQQLKHDLYRPVPTPPPVPPKDETKKPDEAKKIVPSPPALQPTVHVSFVTDPQIPPEVAAVLNDQGLAKWLADYQLNGYHLVSTDQADVVIQARAAGAIPGIVQQDASGKIVAIDRLTTAEAAKKAIGAHLGK